MVHWIMAGAIFGQISLSVNAIPEKVEVILDGNSIGNTPIRKNTITPGSHMFEIEKKGLLFFGRATMLPVLQRPLKLRRSKMKYRWLLLHAQIQNL